MDYKAL